MWNQLKKVATTYKDKEYKDMMGNYNIKNIQESMKDEDTRLHDLHFGVLVEIELMCANEHVAGRKKALDRLAKYKQLKKDFPNNVKITDQSKFYSEDEPVLYKECSVFAFPKQLNWWLNELKNRGIEVDIIHDEEMYK